jgi:hypothetical protein
MDTQTFEASFTPKFHPGDVYATPAAMKKMTPAYASGALFQHLQGKWGLCDAHDWEVNEQSLKTGARLLSVYPLPNDTGDFWIITEAANEDGERPCTTILLPSDY